MLLLKLAIRNVLRQRRRSILTCISMAGGYVLCTLSFSMVDGSYDNVIRIFTEDQTGHLQVHAKGYLDRPRIHDAIDAPEKVETVLKTEASVVSFAPRIYAPALAYAAEEHSPVQVVGIDPELEAATSRLRQKVTAGEWLSGASARELDPAMIGASVADALEIGPGDEIILISQGADGSIANDVFEVRAIIGDRTSVERLGVYLPLQAADRFLSLYGAVHEFAVLLNDIDEARETAAALQSRLPDLAVAPWQEVRETFYKSMQADRRGNTFTLGIVLFIVFIGVLNTVLMSVLERTREFGVLKAIGSRPTLIGGLIMLETAVLAIASVLIGLAIATPVVAWFTWVGILMPEAVDIGGVEFQYLTGAFNAKVLLLPMAIILVYALVVAIFPGIRAARVLPTEAMRTF